MKTHPIPPRLDTCFVTAGLLAAEALPKIASSAQRRYAELNSSPPWSELARQRQAAIQKTMLICLYQAMADWVKKNRVVRRTIGTATGSISIRSPVKIRHERSATELDLAFLFAALAISQGYHAALMVPEAAGMAGAVLALAAEPDIQSAVESGFLHTLTFSQVFKKYRADFRGSDRYYEASCRGLEKNERYVMVPLESEAAAWLRFPLYLEKAVFNILTRDGFPKGTGFFVTRDGYALTCNHVLKGTGNLKVYDKKNRFSIRFLGNNYESSAERFPPFTKRKDDIAVIRVNVDREDFPGFNPLPLGNDYHAGLVACLRGFDRSDTYPLGSFYGADVSFIEKDTAVNIYEEKSALANDVEVLQTPAKKLVKLTDGTFAPGLSGAPVVRMDTGRVFAVHRGWDPSKNWGLCTPMQEFLKVWREYSPCWPDFAFKLI
jgi:hypothetical protein